MTADLAIAEGARWLSLAKPAGLPCFPPHGDPGGDCMLARLLRVRSAQGAHGWPEHFEGGIAHRLDVPTSGLLLAARGPEDLAWLRALFSQGKLRKRYLFATAKDVPWDAHTVATPLAHDKRRKSRMIAQRGRDTPHRGKWYPAHTELRRTGEHVGPLALWEATIVTGVMHQVRVHAASVGLALAGDQRYGGGEPLDPGVPFLLHHLGLSGPGLAPPEIPAPWRNRWP
jgi:23S rRNA-/tRNA-specific pseudouridylate synthase